MAPRYFYQVGWFRALARTKVCDPAQFQPGVCQVPSAGDYILRADPCSMTGWLGKCRGGFVAVPVLTESKMIHLIASILLSLYSGWSHAVSEGEGDKNANRILRAFSYAAAMSALINAAIYLIEDR